MRGAVWLVCFLLLVGGDGVKKSNQKKRKVVTSADFMADADREGVQEIELALTKRELRLLSDAKKSAGEVFSKGMEHKNKYGVARDPQEMMEFLRLAEEAAKTMEKAMKKIRIYARTRTAREENGGAARMVWPRDAVELSTWTEYVYHTAANEVQTTDIGDRLLRKALPHARDIFLHTPQAVSDQRQKALEAASQILIGLRHFCPGVDLLNMVSNYSSDVLAAVDAMQPLGREQFAIGAHGCDPELSLKLFTHFLDKGYMKPEDPTGWCFRCYQIMMITQRNLGKPEEAETFFHEKLSPHVPWLHADQVPTTFNKKLTTVEPQPWLDAASIHVAQLLEEHKADIIREYLAFEVTKLAEDKFLNDHADAWMTREEGGTKSYWQYLYLKSAYNNQWDEQLCGVHFPVTCRVLRNLPELDNRLIFDDSNRCDGFCPSDMGLPGGVAFLHLGPDREVPLHSGPSNQRLKVHLIVRAPEAGPDGFSFTVRYSYSITPRDDSIAQHFLYQAGGTKKEFVDGDVYVFDDSFLHSTRNGGGEHRNVTRVVLDVPIWHPGLESAYLRKNALRGRKRSGSRRTIAVKDEL